MTKKIDAQVLYDLRDELEFCSGTDLQDYFFSEFGEMSPSGYERVDADEAYEFFAMHALKVAHNNGGDFSTAQQWLDIAVTKIEPSVLAVARMRDTLVEAWYRY